MRRFVTFGPALVVLITVAVTLVAGPAAVRRVSAARTEAHIRLARAELDGDNILEEIDRAVRNIASSVEPSVVHISVDVPGSTARRRERVSQGSGWVYDDQGHVVTNAHVVRGSSNILVHFHDGRTGTAELVGVDTPTDIAVVRVDAGPGLFPARRATGAELAQGDRVYAFGSPFGFKFSMSEGIISGLGRDPQGIVGPGGLGYTNFIQTDAAVNPGNSGGPLVDVYGRVVGMNVAIATGTRPAGTNEGQSAGISFAIPLDTIESVVGQLVGGGTVAKGFLGISHPSDDDANRALLESIEYPGRGVYLIAIERGGPAEDAGLRRGDVVVTFNGRAVPSVSALRHYITVAKPGEMVTIGAWRRGEALTVSATLTPQSRSSLGVSASAGALAWFGVSGVSGVDGGLVVGSVREGSGAEEAGLRAEDVIVSVDEAAVESYNGLLLALGDLGFANGRRVSVEVRGVDGRSRRLTFQYRP